MECHQMDGARRVLITDNRRPRQDGLRPPRSRGVEWGAGHGE